MIHQTPLGAGMIIWANERVTLQPAAKDLNFEKIQTTITILKKAKGNFNVLIMSLHVPNKLKPTDKEK